MPNDVTDPAANRNGRDVSSDAIIDAPFDSALSQRYLVYALSTITARSLPDLRDGLKPVHRRLLWTMRQLKLDPTNGYKKSARVVGEVIGKYHPHGDTAAYDAMVRLAQDFSLRYPLVQGQGNFGNIDGDNAAAYRYTEARLTRTAMQLMTGLDEGTVDFIPTYNGEEQEPELMPGLFPNLLANGASGIAVGMATNIPSHNVAEIIDATLELIDEPATEHARLMELFHGPDLPTGGLVVDSAQTIAAAYETGRGSFRMRGRFHAAEADKDADREAGIERLGGGQYQLIISEIPYQVQKGKLIEQIAQLIADRKLPILEDVRDESDENIRLVLVPQKSQCRSGATEGIALQADRSGNAFRPQSQRAGRQPHAAGHGAERAADQLDRGADRHTPAAHPAPAGQDRGAAGTGRGLHCRVPQP